MATTRHSITLHTILCTVHFSVAVSMCFLGLWSEAWGFSIVVPAKDAIVQPGQVLTVVIDPGKDTGLVGVRYFWYRVGEEALVEQHDETATGSIVAPVAYAATAESVPPFGGPLAVPAEAVGPMRLLAVGDISRGRLGTRAVFDEVIVRVEPQAPLTGIEFETDKPLRLGRAGQAAGYGQADVLGKIIDLPVVGLFSDGIHRAIRHPDTGTVYRSSNDKVIRVLTDGLLRLVGNGRTILTASNRGQEGTLEIEVEVNAEPNDPPLADAGAHRTVRGGTKVELNGLLSRDPEGEALFYMWSQVRGSKVPLLDANTPKASFLAPQVSEPKLYRFTLRVTDKQGADSLPAHVDITVQP